MITNSQIRVIESSLEKLKPKIYGMKADYECKIIEKNIKWHSVPTSNPFHGYHPPILEIKVRLTGPSDMYIVTAGMMEFELEGFLTKVYSYVLPRDHFFNKNVRPAEFKFYHNGDELLYKDLITSFKYDEFRKKFRKDNSPGTLVTRENLGYSINYSDLGISEWTDRQDMNVYIECWTKSFNYINENGQSILITDEIWSDFYQETEEPIDMVKESLIVYLNTKSSEYGSELSEEFAQEMNFYERLSPYVREEYGWRYEAMCYSLTNPNELPYDYTQGDVERKNLFLNFCYLNLNKD